MNVIITMDELTELMVIFALYSTLKW